MQQKAGTFIVIEGTDGSGKGTQFQLLAERLTEAGYDVATFDFPQYDQPSSYFVREYLNGKYGTAEEVGPYTGSLFYALDRFEAAGKIREALSEGKIVLANRFVGSNMAHQGTKFEHAEERRGYFIWLDNLEFEMLRVPRPDISFVLRVPAEIAQGLVDQKEARNYTDKKRDLHESDISHLQRAVSVYDEMCELFPRDFIRVDCVRNDQLMTIEAVQELLWQKISPLLPPPPQLEMSTPKIASARTKPAVEATIVADPYVRKVSGQQYEITSTGRALLEEIAVQSDRGVYALTNRLAPLTIAAAMAQSCATGKDLRVTLLEDFAGGSDKITQATAQAVNTHGTATTQRFASMQLILSSSSALLASDIAQEGTVSYLVPTNFAVAYDQKDATGNYQYCAPRNLPDDLKAQYSTHMDQIFDLYAVMVRKLTGHIRQRDTLKDGEQEKVWKSRTRVQARAALQSVLPVATTTTIGLNATAYTLQQLLARLQGSASAEAHVAAERLTDVARNLMPAVFTDESEVQRSAQAAYQHKTAAKLREFSQQNLPPTLAAETSPLRLADVWPRNEFELIPDMLYPYSAQPYAEIAEQVKAWPYAKKADVYEAYLGERLSRGHTPGQALRKARYYWDIVSSFSTFTEIQRHHDIASITRQELTPRYGYEVPVLIEEAGLSDQFEACFDISLKLYSILQGAGFTAEAQYAVLHGHRMRWTLCYTGEQAFDLHESYTNPAVFVSQETKQLIDAMHQKLSEVHPLLAGSMRFVNKADDPELLRLANERSEALRQASTTQPV